MHGLRKAKGLLIQTARGEWIAVGYAFISYSSENREQAKLFSWRDITTITAGGAPIVGLKKDGTVIRPVGKNSAYPIFTRNDD